jgi:hypothetical protein
MRWLTVLLLGCKSMPEDEKRFCDLVESSRKQYARVEGNEIQEKETFTERNHAFRSFAPKNWIGKAGKVDTTSAGATFEVELPCDAKIKTWNNSISDAGSGTNIKKESRLYSVVSSVTPGQRVRFSADLLNNEKGDVIETSLTKSGSMREPELVARFADVTIEE